MIGRMGLCALLALAAGCGPRFSALTPPPLARSAALDSSGESIQISRGVALAFDCRIIETGAPCDKATAVVDDPKIADVLPAHLAQLSDGWHRKGPQPESAFVVWGIAPGKTKLRVRAEGYDDEIEITVVDEQLIASPR